MSSKTSAEEHVIRDEPAPVCDRGSDRDAARSRLLNQVSAFHYVTAPSAPTYRAVMQVFYEAKQRYVIELRPGEVLELIRGSDFHTELRDETELEQKLGQLVDWGNLLRSHDTATVSRIDDFYRKRYLFHLTAVGEAAHRAVLEVEATIGKSGSLQTAMLVKIRDTLRDLADTAADPVNDPAVDPAVLVRLLHDLQAAFATLTQEANRFLGDLDHHLGGERMDEDRFVAHKRALLSYLSGFITALRQLAAEIAASIATIDDGAAGMDRIIAAAVPGASLPPALDGVDPALQWMETQRIKWDGIRAWFAGSRAGHPPTVERLADVAKDAVVGLTRTLGRLNDRRTRPVDRAADFRTLARWFAACASEDDAHRLWHAAFGLHAGRHFHLAEEDEELTHARVSWWDATPVEVPVKLRTRGSTSKLGRAAPVPDHRTTRQWIAVRLARERAQREAAMRRFAGADPLRFSDLAALDATELDMLLSLLNEVLGTPRDQDGVRRTRTTDGRLHIALEPPEAGDTSMVTIATPHGRLRCRNYRLHVTEVRTEVRARAAHARAQARVDEGAGA